MIDIDFVKAILFRSAKYDKISFIIHNIEVYVT